MNTWDSPKMSRWTRAITVCLIIPPMLVACFKTNVPTSDGGVSIHGVNYSEQDFSYVLVDPKDKSNNGGGETIGRYEAGGTMCCYSLPKKWYPELTVIVDSTYWLAKKADGTLPEVHDTQTVVVPAYAEPAEIWVLREADGKTSVVVSDFQPNHPNWPGKIKGWPIPSQAYRHERWALMKHLAESDVAGDEFLMQEYVDDPEKRAMESWNVTLQYRPKDLLGFSNYQDPNFREQLRADDKKRLFESTIKLDKLKRSEP